MVPLGAFRLPVPAAGSALDRWRHPVLSVELEFHRPLLVACPFSSSSWNTDETL